MFSIINAQAVIAPTQSSMVLNDPGFQERGNSFIQTAHCSGSAAAMNVFGIVPCKNLDIDDEPTCFGVPNCEWRNETLIFNITVTEAVCTNNMNLTFYNITKGKNDLCDDIEQKQLCDLIQCVWINQTDAVNQVSSFDETATLTSVWDTIKFIAGFRVDLGIGALTFIFTFLFFYIPFIMLIWSLYMAIPFLH